MAGKHTERYGEKHDVRLDIWAPNTPKEKIINSWLDNPPESIAGQNVLWAGGTYHDKVEFVLQSPEGMLIPVAIYHRVLHLLTLGMDRDVNVHHVAWGVDTGAEYYHRIFR